MAIDVDIDSLRVSDFQDYNLIDIREHEEILDYPSVLPCPHIPFSGFPDNIHEFDKSEKYLLFCAMGGRSHYMAEALRQMGVEALSVNNGIASVNAYLKKIAHAPSSDQ